MLRNSKNPVARIRKGRGSRQRIHFVTQKLKAKGLITVRYAQIKVCDVARLSARAQQGG